jgi:hypothetical protein
MVLTNVRFALQPSCKLHRNLGSNICKSRSAYLLEHACDHGIDGCHIGWLPVAWQANWSWCWNWGAIMAVWARHATHLRSRWRWCQLRMARAPASASAVATAARATVLVLRVIVIAPLASIALVPATLSRATPSAVSAISSTIPVASVPSAICRIHCQCGWLPVR